MKKFLLAAVALVPGLTMAQTLSFGNVQDTLNSVSLVIDRLIPIIIGLALLLFLIGVLKYVTAGGDEEARAAARGMIIFGIIALFVMTAVWGFVRILSSTIFGGSNVENVPSVPRIPIPTYN
jgi:ABC-type transport system involved in cytochrome bd biosynthesis fused ATPase/permease subunit